MKRSIAILSLSTLALGCGAAGSTPATATLQDPGGKADGDGVASFTLLPAGSFSDVAPDVHPNLVHYGFVSTRGGDWQDVGDAAITFTDHQSDAIDVEIPADVDGGLLAFVVHAQTFPSGEQWTAPQYVALDAPAGRVIHLPLQASAPYPFECYDVRVKNADQDWVSFPGKPVAIYYGYTDATLAGYDADNDVAWYDVDGAATAEDVLTPDLRHDGDYKGSYRLLDTWVRVPAAMNLVFKLGIEKYDGSCAYGFASGAPSYAETQTYFAE